MHYFNSHDVNIWLLNNGVSMQKQAIQMFKQLDEHFVIDYDNKHIDIKQDCYINCDLKILPYQFRKADIIRICSKTLSSCENLPYETLSEYKKYISCIFYGCYSLDFSNFPINKNALDMIAVHDNHSLSIDTIFANPNLQLSVLSLYNNNSLELYDLCKWDKLRTKQVIITFNRRLKNLLNLFYLDKANLKSFIFEEKDVYDAVPISIIHKINLNIYQFYTLLNNPKEYVMDCALDLISHGYEEAAEL